MNSSGFVSLSTRTRYSIDSFNDSDRIGSDRTGPTSPYFKAGYKCIHWTVGVYEFQWDCLQCRVMSKLCVRR